MTKETGPHVGLATFSPGRIDGHAARGRTHYLIISDMTHREEAEDSRGLSSGNYFREHLCHSRRKLSHSNSRD
jgi:hypothetical protein